MYVILKYAYRDLEETKCYCWVFDQNKNLLTTDFCRGEGCILNQTFIKLIDVENESTVNGF